MATAQTFIEAALRKLQVKGAETPLTTQELTDGLESLNDMGAELEAEGFELGYTELSVVGDTVTIPAYANAYYKLQLAGRLAPEYLSDGVPAFLIELVQSARRIVVRELNSRQVGVSGSYQNIIFAAIEMAGAKAGNEPITAIEVTNSLPALDDLMTTLESNGFRMSYRISNGTNITDLSGLPDWSWGWIKAELASRLSITWSVPVNSVVANMMEEGRRQAYMRTTTAPSVDLPDTLPTGSGNDHSNGSFRRFFRDETADDLLTETGSSIKTETGLTLEIN